MMPFADMIQGLGDETSKRSQTLHHFLTEHASSLKKYEAAERLYEQVVAEYRDGDVNQALADIRASSDRRLKQAVSDCGFYRDRAMLYGISALVELARGGLK